MREKKVLVKSERCLSNVDKWVGNSVYLSSSDGLAQKGGRGKKE